jgi:hypothetical protein
VLVLLNFSDEVQRFWMCRRGFRGFGLEVLIANANAGEEGEPEPEPGTGTGMGLGPWEARAYLVR